MPSKIVQSEPPFLSLVLHEKIKELKKLAAAFNAEILARDAFVYNKDDRWLDRNSGYKWLSLLKALNEEMQQIAAMKFPGPQLAEESNEAAQGSSGTLKNFGDFIVVCRVIEGALRSVQQLASYLLNTRRGTRGKVLLVILNDDVQARFIAIREIIRSLEKLE